MLLHVYRMPIQSTFAEKKIFLHQTITNKTNVQCNQ